MGSLWYSLCQLAKYKLGVSGTHFARYQWGVSGTHFARYQWGVSGTHYARYQWGGPGTHYARYHRTSGESLVPAMPGTIGQVGSLWYPLCQVPYRASGVYYIWHPLSLGKVEKCQAKTFE